MSKKATKKTEPKNAARRSRKSSTQENASAEAPREAAPAAASPSLEQIRERAYEIFRSGKNPSDPIADWFQAERELKGEARA
jgi:hypothetical protein